MAINFNFIFCFRKFLETKYGQKKKITHHITINNYYKKFDLQIDFNSNKTYGGK